MAERQYGEGTPEAQVLEAESARINSMIANDLDAIALMLDEELTYTHSSGVTHNRQEYLELMKNAELSYDEISFDPKIHMVGGAGVLHASMRARIRMEGRERHLAGSYLAVWGLRDGRWTLRAVQSTSAAAAK